jgi:hypothetical protein
LGACCDEPSEDERIEHLVSALRAGES